MQELVQKAQSRILTDMQGAASALLTSQAQILSGIVPVDLQAAQDGDWRAFGDWSQCTILFYKGIGTAGEDPIVRMQQAQDAAGTGAKDLTFTQILLQENVDLTVVNAFTTITQAAASSYALDSSSAESEVILALNFLKTDLDQAGGFDFLRFRVDDVGVDPQLGAALYIFHNLGVSPGLLRAEDLRVGLYSNALSLVSTTTLADITEPVFTGYSRKSFTSWTLGTRSTGNKYLASGSLLWQATALPSGNQTIRGAFLVNTIVNELVSYWPLPAPLTINHIGQILECSPEFGINDQSAQELVASTS